MSESISNLSALLPRTSTELHESAAPGEPRPKRQRSGSRQRSASRSASGSRTADGASRGRGAHQAQAEGGSEENRAAPRPPRPPRRPRSAAGAAAAAAGAAVEAVQAKAPTPSAAAEAMSPEELEEEVGRLEPAATMLRQRQVRADGSDGAPVTMPMWIDGLLCLVHSSDISKHCD